MPFKDKEKQRESQRRWYQNNKAKAGKWTADAKTKKQAEYLAFKATLKCEICGESESACLDFHHKDPSEKDNIISQVAKTWSLERLKKEIDKCMVLCANCHRKVHAGILADGVMVAHLAVNQTGVGSSPTLPAKYPSVGYWTDPNATNVIEPVRFRPEGPECR